jgi:hypothetical protein
VNVGKLNEHDEKAIVGVMKPQRFGLEQSMPADAVLGKEGADDVCPNPT